MRSLRLLRAPPIALASSSSFCFFFFNDTATTEIYTLSLHDALPISARRPGITGINHELGVAYYRKGEFLERSEEHTSELQSQSNLVCRLLLEKKKNFTAKISKLTM